MKKYLVLETQENGCDYTIACGQRWQLIEANNMLEAIDEYLIDTDGEDSDLRHFNDDCSPDFFEIYEVGKYMNKEHCMDIYNSKLKREKEKKEEIEGNQDIKKEKEQLAKLKEKYEN